jgi:hypothetical protein
LGLFDQLMLVHPTIFVEHYSGYLNTDHIARCLTRMDLYVTEEKKDAKKRSERLSPEQRPFTWMLATACSEKMLRSFGAKLDPALGPGIYRIPTGFRMGIVEIRSLPETPETVWLRGLGESTILTKAFTNIRELPETKRERNDIVEVCIKHFKYLTEKSSTGLSNEEAKFMKTMQEIDTIYRAEKHQARLDGACDLVLRLLNRRVGNISIDLQTQVKALPLEQLGLLGEDLLDFAGLKDLLEWLEANGA